MRSCRRGGNAISAATSTFTWTPLREDAPWGQVIDAAVPVVLGVTPAGKRDVLGVSVGPSEAEVHWRHFLEQLAKRGLHGVKPFVSDSHARFKAARAAVSLGCHGIAASFTCNGTQASTCRDNRYARP